MAYKIAEDEDEDEKVDVESSRFRIIVNQTDKRTESMFVKETETNFSDLISEDFEE